ncbi:hypothetical protein EBU71_20640 [bacterium]|nr:hypothetical protein [Candidatus Elulimicrobium humile]
MSVQVTSQLLEGNSLSIELAEKYLNIYLGEANWSEKISQLWTVQSKKHGEEKAKEIVKKSIACACLSPVINKVTIPEENHVLIFWVSGWPQFHERDWFAMFKEVVKIDIEIEKNRTVVMQSGIFEQIDIPPMTRQAYNWLYEKLDQEKFNTLDQKDKCVTKMKNLVRVYGGAVICNLFTNYHSNIDKVLNWKSGYFIEKELYKIYSLDQIIRIKNAEIQKTNSNYIRKISN